MRPLVKPEKKKNTIFRKNLTLMNGALTCGADLGTLAYGTKRQDLVVPT